jgi:hypothetical protein
MTKVEKVARAIFETWAASTGGEGTWDEAVKAHGFGRAEYPAAFDIVELGRAEARAAIEAMPFAEDGNDCPEHVRIAGEEAYHENGDCRAIFNAMIAALSEGDAK